MAFIVSNSVNFKTPHNFGKNNKKTTSHSTHKFHNNEEKDVVILRTLVDKPETNEKPSRLKKAAQKVHTGILWASLPFFMSLNHFNAMPGPFEQTEDFNTDEIMLKLWERPENEDKINQTISFSEAIKEKLSETNEDGFRYALAIAENKDSLMKDLDLSNDEFDEIANVAIKIADNESKLSANYKYQAMAIAESFYPGAFAASKIRENKKEDKDPTLSRGMSQYKIAMASDEEKALFDKYGVTYDNLTTNIQYPEKSAIATIIHLGTLQKGYNQYISGIKEAAPDMNDEKVKSSIENAKSILFNDDLRPKAIKALSSINGSQEETDFMKEVNLTHKDLEDLRILARCIELPRKGYIAARWNGKNITPYGEKQDLGCANLLNAEAGVGYIGKILKDV